MPTRAELAELFAAGNIPLDRRREFLEQHNRLPHDPESTVSQTRGKPTDHEDIPDILKTHRGDHPLDPPEEPYQPATVQGSQQPRRKRGVGSRG